MDIKNLEQHLLQLVDETKRFIDSFEIEIGVIDGRSKNERKLAKFGLTNADLMFIHENGSPLHNIPARPVLEMTIRHFRESGMLDKTVLKCIDMRLSNNATDSDIEAELKRLCSRMQTYCRNIIYDNDGRLAPNAESTVKTKGFNHPLFQTGQLARSIVCQLVKKS